MKRWSEREGEGERGWVHLDNLWDQLVQFDLEKNREEELGLCAWFREWGGVVRESVSVKSLV